MYYSLMRMGVIGSSGLVGEAVVRLLVQRGFEPVIFFRNDPLEFSNIDILFLCTPSEVSKKLAPLALDSGAAVIDLSSAFRKEFDVPLILPEVNGELLESNPKLISCPNCIVAIMLMALGPLHKSFIISRMQISTYQSASGAGKEGLNELLQNLPPKIFPHQLLNNLFMHESPKLETGYSEEEDKIIFETKKILGSPGIGVNVRSVRVSTLRAHSIAINVTFKEDPIGAEAVLKKTQGIQYNPSPNPKHAEHKEDVFYGPLRKDLSQENTLDLFIVGDQLLRGAALTAVEIAIALQQNKLHYIALPGSRE